MGQSKYHFLKSIGIPTQCHPATLALAWAKGHPDVTAPIIGGRDLDQLQPSLAALDFEMSAEMRAEIAALSTEPPPATDRAEVQA